MKQPGGVRHRARRNAAQWRELVDRYEREGRGREGFCAAHGLALSTLFDLWRRKLRGAPAVREAEPKALFVELSNPAVPNPGAGFWEVELELGAGMVLRVRRAGRC